MVQDDASYFTAIRHEGCLSQANHYLANKPSDGSRRELKRMIDRVQHPAGPSFTAIGDMSNVGRVSRADKRVTNNHLELASFAPQDMSDEAMLQQGIAQSNVASSAYASNLLDLEARQHDYVPTTMSEDEMLQLALRESTSTIGADIRGGSNQHSMAVSRHTIEDNRKMPAATIAYASNAVPPYPYTSGRSLQLSSHSPSSLAGLHSSSIINSLSTSTAFTPNDNGIHDNADDDTPMIIVRTRDQLIQNRSLRRNDMNPDQRQSSALAIGALSCPHDKTYFNIVMANATKPTPERADEVMFFAEDDPKRKRNS